MNCQTAALYQVDAFTTRPFGGNPAAIIPLSSWWPDELLQQIAAENNLSETAYVVRSDDGYHLRWFTPTTEVDLCGHATLAAAFVILTEITPHQTEVRFQTRSGTLAVRQNGDHYSMDFPALETCPCACPHGLANALGCEVQSARIGMDYLIAVESESVVRQVAPDFSALRTFDQARGFIVTAAGEQCDFVSRYFAPNFGIDEDPVTGSAHCALAPYWAERLGRTELTARQISSRGGEIRCRLVNDRVELTGQAVKYLEGQIVVPGSW